MGNGTPAPEPPESLLVTETARECLGPAPMSSRSCVYLLLGTTKQQEAAMSAQTVFNIFTANDDSERAAFPTSAHRAPEPQEMHNERPCESPRAGAFDAMSARILEMSAKRRLTS